MGHKDLLVTHTLYRQRDYSDAHDRAPVARGSFLWNSGYRVLLGGPSMWIDRQDLLYAIRSARRAPLLSGIAVVALSLGIGLNAGVFTLLNAMFLNPPTQKEPYRFVQ